MAFNISNDLFDAVFSGKITVPKASDFKMQLADYLSKLASTEAKQMSEWIRKGGKMSSFRCREDLVDPISSELSEMHIPYALIVRTDGQLGFLTRRDDKEAVDKAKAHVMERLGHTCTIVSLEEMKHSLAKKKKNERAMITLNGLSGEFVELLREMYTEKYQDCEIAIDRRQDGTYSIGVPGEAHVLRSRMEDQTDLCHTYLSILMKEAGPYGAMVMGRAALQNQFNEAMTKGFISEGNNLQKTPLWIVGRGTQYVKVLARSFEYGRAKRDSKYGVSLNTEFQAGTMQPNYTELLNSKCQRIPNKMMTYSFDDVLEHFKAELSDAAYDKLDSSETAEERAYMKKEQKLIDKIDAIVYNKIQGDPTMLLFGRYDEKIAVYMQTAKNLIEAMMKGIAPEGFEKGDIDELYSVVDEVGIDVDEYKGVLPGLDKVEPVLLKDTIEKIADIDQLFEHTMSRAKERNIEREVEREEKYKEIKSMAKAVKAAREDKGEEFEL